MTGLAFLSPFPIAPRSSGVSSLVVKFETDSDLDTYERVITEYCVEVGAERKMIVFGNRRRRAMMCDLILIAGTVL